MTEHAHHPAADAPVRSHEPVSVHPQFMPEASAPYVAQAAQERTALNLQQRIDQLFDRAEACNRRMAVIEERVALYERNLGI